MQKKDEVLYQIINTKYFFKNMENWKANGVTGDDIDFAGNVASFLLDLPIIVYKNKKMNCKDFDSLMENL